MATGLLETGPKLNWTRDNKIYDRYCHGMIELVKVHRKDQSVKDFTCFYCFGQFRVFL